MDPKGHYTPAWKLLAYFLRGHKTKTNKGNNKITELRTILQRESQNS